MKILIADDEPVSRRMLQRLLMKWGYEVVSVTDGKAAWEQLSASDAPRIALLDWMMPGQNGGMQMQMAKITMTALADMLMQFMDRPIVDATKLKGNYQVTLDLPIDLMGGMPAAQKLTAILGLGSFGMAPDSSSAAIFQAVNDLGLELKSRKAPVETIIVDHVEKTPTAN